MDLQRFKCKQEKKSKWNATGALKNDNYLFIQVENFLKSFIPSLQWNQNVNSPFFKSIFYDCYMKSFTKIQIEAYHQAKSFKTKIGIENCNKQNVQEWAIYCKYSELNLCQDCAILHSS